MLDAEGGDRTDGHHRNRKSDAETEHQRGAKCELLELQAQQQDGDRGRAGDKPASKAEYDDLTRRHLLIGEAPANVISVRALMSVREFFRANGKARSLRVFMLVEFDFESGGALSVDYSQPGEERMGFRNVRG